MMTPLNQQYIRVKTIDPAVLCPAEGYILPAECPSHGYILDEPGASEWVLLATFQTNSPGTTTFDPVVDSAGAVDLDFAWEVGGVFYYVKSLSITLDGTLQTVKLYAKKTITGWLTANDHIVGTLDLSYSYFQTLTSIRLETNAELTSVLLPANITGTITQLMIYSCNLTGELSLIGVKNINGSIYLNSNPNLTKIVFSESITGTLNLLILNSCNLTGSLNLKGFTTMRSTQTDIHLYGNANLTEVEFASSTTGFIRQLYLYNNTSMSGTLDLSGLNFKSATAILFLYSTSISKVIFKVQTASILQFRINSAAVTDVNFTDVTGFTSVNSCIVNLSDNGMSASVVNKMLVDLDTVSVSGYTSRSISIAGTNAAPDSSSGGHDGLAAKTSLEGKGFTVSVTV